MNYLLGQLVWDESVEAMPRWQAPDVFNDKIIDLRTIAQCGTPRTQQGYALIATPRDPLPGETLLASAFNESLSAKANDAVKDLLQIPEALAAPNLPELINLLMGIYSGTGLICPPMMPDHRGRIRFNLDEIAVSYRCPTVGTQWENILVGLKDQYRAVYESPDTPEDLHRKMLAVWQRKLGIEDHEVFIPADLPKETPVKPTTTRRDNFNVGDHADLSGQASSDGWTWFKFAGTATALFRTNTQVYAESINQHVGGQNFCLYRAESDLSSTDHYVQGILRTQSNNEAVGMIARKDSSATFTSYAVILSATNDRLEILKFVASVGTGLQNNSLTINTATDYLIRFVINGSTLQTLNSGTQVGADLTDTAIAAGLRCGMFAFLTAGLGPETGGVDDFEASDNLSPSVTDYYYRQMRA